MTTAIASYDDNATRPDRLSVTDFISLPRPSANFAFNSSKSVALWPSTQYDFTTSRTEKSLYLVDVQGGHRVILAGLTYQEFAWLDDKTILYLRPPTTAAADGVYANDHIASRSDTQQEEHLKSQAEKTGIEIWAIDIKSKESYKLASLPVSIANIQITFPSGGKALLAFSAKVFADGNIYNVAAEKKRATEAEKGSDVQVYDGLFIRHWDEWKSTIGDITQLHFVHFSQNPNSLTDDRWSADLDQVAVDEKGEKRIQVTSPLAGTKIECPYGPFGSAGDYSLSSTHLLFQTKDAHVNPAWHTRMQIYLVPLSPPSSVDAKPVQLTVGTQGSTASPKLSPDGKRAMWLEQRKDGYEADRNRVMVYEIEPTGNGSGGKRWEATPEWDRSPAEVQWKDNGEGAWLLTEDRGHSKVFSLHLPVSPPASYMSPIPDCITHQHSVSQIEELADGSAVVAVSSFTSPSALFKISTRVTSVEEKKKPASDFIGLASLTEDLAVTKGLDKGTEFSFTGSEGVENHGFILFPPNHAEQVKDGKKFPMLFLVHGGPQGAWSDAWSTRWNYNIFTAHGYIVVAINPTGSTGYGQAFTDGIKNQWGGRPYQDLIAGLEYVKETYKEIDGERTAMMGASYGGYMANWMQGHNDLTRFQAFVCHNGVFSTPAVFYSTDELYFPEQEYDGTPWDARDNYERWNPANHVDKWKTPQMIIHGGLDYRLPETEGIAAFNALQRRGIPSRFVYFPTENHFCQAPRNSMRWHEEILKFVGHWTSDDSTSR